MKLVELKPLIPDVLIALRYATTNNIAGKVLYNDQAMASARLEATTARRLARAAQLFRAQTLRLVIWDAFRPISVQKTLRLINDDDQYVRQISYHSLGKAVDVTLAAANAELLDMGTDFDEFTPQAHTLATGLTSTQMANRHLLRELMEQAGFTAWPAEWWHFDDLT